MIGIDSLGPEDSVRDVSATRRRPRFAWVAAGLLLVSALGFAGVGLAGPTSCASCHDDGAFRTQTQASPHAAVECTSCHVGPGVLGQAVFALQRPLHRYVPLSPSAARDAAAVSDSRCEACHADALQGVSAAGGIRIKHTTCASALPCTECHSSTAHGSATKWLRSYDMEGCIECHAASKNTRCDLCHDGQPAAARVKSVAFAVTHGPNWQSTHGMGTATTCIVCHAVGDCAECHGTGVPHEAKYVEVHASDAVQGEARCASCHEDEFCTSCHGTVMPHPAGFTQRHMADAKQSELCARCHDESDCTGCHLKHVHPGGVTSSTSPKTGGQR